MADKKPQMKTRIQPDKSVLFDVIDDGITIQVSFDSPTQIKIDMWRDADGIYVAQDVGNVGTVSFREKTAKRAREKFNPPASAKDGEGKVRDTVPHLDMALEQIARTLGVPDLADILKPEEATTLVDRLVEIVEEDGYLFLTPSGRAHVSVTVEGHTETYALDDAPFGDFLRGHFYKTERDRLRHEAEDAYARLVQQLGSMIPERAITARRPPVVKEQTIGDAISQLKSIAVVEKRVEEVFLRGGRGADGKFYLDLCNDEWEAVEIDSEGWRVVRNPPVRFVRAKGMLPLPKPERGGSVGDLKDLLNIADDDPDSPRNWSLLLAWLVQALRPSPQHPILALKGGEGTAKSFTAYLLRMLVDPHDSPDDYNPPDLRTLCIWAEHEWVIALDNISSMPEWLSNAMCKLVTGMGFKVRTLYKDRGLEIFKARRPITLNGIADIGSNKDLMSRTLLVNLPVITKYQLESEILERFEEKRPRILGALLDAVSAGIAKLPNLKVEGRGSRMPDFDLWGRATEEALGIEAGSFMRARGQAEREATQTSLDAEPIAATIERFAMSYTEDRPWEGTAQVLLDQLNELETDPVKKRDKHIWPSTPEGMASKLRKLASSLMTEGVSVRRNAGRSASNRGGWQIFYKAPEDGDGDSSEDGPVETVTQTVTQETPIDKRESPRGDSGDSGDSPKPATQNGEDEEDEEGEV